MRRAERQTCRRRIDVTRACPEGDDRFVLELVWPTHLTADDRSLIATLAERNAAQFGAGFLGLVLSGSAARGMATDHSDLDVYVVLSDEVTQVPAASRSPAVDEIPVSLSDLEVVPPFGSQGWWQRWSFAWAPTLLDRTDGRIAAAVHRQATLSPDESDAVLIDHDRLDGWLNLAYRALKSDRAGRPAECRLDAAESVPWLLDVVFALAGSVRPYNTYLAWELVEHPVEGWPVDTLLPILQGLLDGDPKAVRAAFARVEEACTARDADHGDGRTSEIITGWGDELHHFRSTVPAGRAERRGVRGPTVS